MATSLRMVALGWLTFVCQMEAIYSQAIPQIDGDTPSTPVLGVASDIEFLEREHIRSYGLPPGVMREYRLREISFSELVQWDIGDEAEELGTPPMSTLVKSLSKSLDSRKKEKEENLQKLEKRLGAVSLVVKPQEAALMRREAEENFLKEERESEEHLAAVVEELFPPRQFTALMRMLIKTNYQRIGGSRLLSAHLELAPGQIPRLRRRGSSRPKSSLMMMVRSSSRL